MTEGFVVLRKDGSITRTWPTKREAQQSAYSLSMTDTKGPYTAHSISIGPALPPLILVEAKNAR